MNRQETPPFQALGLFNWRGFERFPVGSEPRFRDPVALYPSMNSASYSFHLWEFWHAPILNSPLQIRRPNPRNPLADLPGTIHNFASALFRRELIVLGVDGARNAPLPQINQAHAQPHREDANR